MTRKLILLLALCLSPLCSALRAQQMPELPFDPALRHGKLPNGLTYYIRHNNLPEHQVNFYIAQRVGSVQEEDNQRGLAHFLEHMCFNGTQHFPGNQLVKYCESIGVKFGQNLNAYTSTDETVYNIDDVPSTPQNIDSCLLILHDWADGLLLEPEEIDKERGVIHEEWRLRSSASQRIYERQLLALYPGSRYAYRMPIGTMEVVDNFKPEALRAYYEKWYRPDLQGIIVVGDINVDSVETAIKRIFSPIEMPAQAAPYELYPVPDNAEPIYLVDKDKEQQQPVIMAFWKTESLSREQRGTMALLLQNMLTGVSCPAINARLDELAKQPSCPFVAAQVDYDHYAVSKTCDAFMLYVVPKSGQAKEAMQAAMGEVERVQRYGLTDTEIIRQREEMLSRMEKLYDNREKQRNDFYVPQYVRHFLEGNALPDLETEYQLYRQLSPMLTGQVVNPMLQQLTASVDTNFVVLAMFPDKEGEAVPTAEELKSAVQAARSAELEAYVDKVKNEPLIARMPKPGSIKKQEQAPFGYTLLTLSNGVRVYYRQTDFNNSQVIMRASSPGGTDMLPESDLTAAQLLSPIMQQTGAGSFTGTELEKALAGKQVSLGVSLSSASEGLSGQSTPKDLRTLLELTYLAFAQPSNDPAAYDNFMQMLHTQLSNAEKVPETALNDSLQNTLFDHSPRHQQLHLSDLQSVSYDKVRRIYADRFRTASDFTFYFTGNFQPDSLRLYCQQYLASLPSGRTEKRPAELGRMHQGTLRNHFVREMETPKSYIIQVWNGDYPYSMKQAAVVSALGEILSQRYIKSIREEGSMAYSVNASAELSYGRSDRYVLQIVCPVKPEMMEDALGLMRKDIEAIAQSGVTAEELAKVVEFERKDYAESQRKNSYWQGLIAAQAEWGRDGQTGYLETLEGLTSADLQHFAADVLLKQGNCVTVTMLPAEKK